MNNAKTDIIVDLDGTLADIDHRLHFIKGDVSHKSHHDWERFHAAADGDAPILEIITLVRAMWKDGFIVRIATARSDCQREQTTRWLNEHSVPFDSLHMRRSGDWRSDSIVKMEMFPLALLDRVAFVVEDRKSVVRMWRNMGLRVLQVCEGDY